ncbi:MAG TPA: hypothetical protein VHD32_13420 [Candidatus Didemnitutus sp.]|nr:hypothetical protein [Candidatus Didemnitutus sp.]
MLFRPALRRTCLSAVLIVSAAFTCLARADDSSVSTQYQTVTVPDGKFSTKEVHDIVVAAATERGYEIKVDSAEKVVAYLNKHGHEASITLVISDKAVEFWWEGYKTDGKGNRLKPEKPTNWASNLVGDVTKGLKKADGK